MATLCKIAVLLLTLISLADLFTGADLGAAKFGLVLVLLFTGARRMGGAFRNITLFFGAAGTGLLLYGGLGLAAWIAAFTDMVSVIAILAVMQLFAVPMAAGRYNLAVEYWLRKWVKDAKTLFLVTTVVTHIIASFLMFGSIPVVVAMLGEMLQKSVANYQRFMTAAVSRGYVATSLWSPGAINLFLVAQATGSRWVDLFIPGVILAVIAISTSYFLELPDAVAKSGFQRHSVPAALSGIDEWTARQKARAIGIVIIALVALAAGLDKLGLGNSAGRIALAGAAVSLAWIFSVRREPDFAPVIADYWQQGVLRSVDVYSLFIAMGIFSAAVKLTGLLAAVQLHLQAMANVMGVYAIVALPLLIILASLVGIHPFISIVMVGQVFTSLKLPVAPATVALCLALGGSIAYAASPFAGVIFTLAKYAACSPQDIAFRWNWRYCLVFFIEGIVFAYLWGLI
ncbi:MAG: hypothetical protein N2491_05765 [Negativicutes bacterium]|nr:hypothetical protein [Negativicutes bacterium]